MRRIELGPADAQESRFSVQPEAVGIGDERVGEGG